MLSCQIRIVCNKKARLVDNVYTSKIDFFLNTDDYKLFVKKKFSNEFLTRTDWGVTYPLLSDPT